MHWNYISVHECARLIISPGNPCLRVNLDAFIASWIIIEKHIRLTTLLSEIISSLDHQSFNLELDYKKQFSRFKEPNLSIIHKRW